MKKVITTFVIGLVTGIATISFLFVIIRAVLGVEHIDITFNPASAMIIIGIYAIGTVILGLLVDFILNLIWHERKQP